MLCIHVIITIEIVILGISQASPFLNKLPRPDLHDSENKDRESASTVYARIYSTELLQNYISCLVCCDVERLSPVPDLVDPDEAARRLSFS